MIRTVISLAALAGALSAVPVVAQDNMAPTTAQADAFVKQAEDVFAKESVDGARIAWINATYITDDTDALAADSGAKLTELSVRYALDAAKYIAVPGLSADTRRKLDIMRAGITLPAPTRPGAATELATISTRLASAYGKGQGTLDGKAISGSDIEAAMGTERDPAKTKEMWVSWHDNVGAPMRADYGRMTAIANEGAKGLGYDDLGAMWRSNYDMPPAEFAAMTDTLWKQVEPLYLALHTYVRGKLNEKYGDAVQAKTGPIRADLLGNMWAQEWGNIYDVVAPAGAGDLGYDSGELL